MSAPAVSFEHMIAQGDAIGYTLVHKFGKNLAVGTSYVPIALGGTYPTPQVSGATTLRIQSGGHASDTAAGSGARTVTLEGLSATGAEYSETLTTAGASASAATTGTFLRLFRAYVATSGTYSTISAGSHVGAITIENGAGGTNWAVINATDYPKGQSEIGCYTIPLGYTGYLHHFDITVDSSKAVSAMLLRRDNILQTAAPYKAMRELFILGPIGAPLDQMLDFPRALPELTDLICMAKVPASTEVVSIFLEIVLKAN